MYFFCICIFFFCFHSCDLPAHLTFSPMKAFLKTHKGTNCISLQWQLCACMGFVISFQFSVVKYSICRQMSVPTHNEDNL